MPEEMKVLGCGHQLKYSRVRARQWGWVLGWRWNVLEEVQEVAEGKGLYLLTIEDG